MTIHGIERAIPLTYGDIQLDVEIIDVTDEHGVTMPYFLTGKFACYQGYDGSTDRCDISRTGDTITASASELLPRQNMTIAIGFDPSTFVDPPDLSKHWAFAILPWVLLGSPAPRCSS